MSPRLSDLVARGRELAGRRFARDVGALWVAQVVGVVAVVIQAIVSARVLGPTTYGVAALAVAWPTLVKNFFDAGSSDATVKYLAEFHEKADAPRALSMTKVGYSVDATIALAALGVVAATAGWAEDHLLHRPDTASLMVLMAVAMLADSPFSTSKAVLSTFGRFRTDATLISIVTLVRSGLIIGLVLAGGGVAGVVWGNAIALVLEGALYVVVAGRVVRTELGSGWWSAKVSHLRGRRREIGRYLLLSDASTFLELVVKQGDQVILGLIKNPTQVGYYRLAKSITSLSNYAVGPMQQVIYPRFTRLWANRDVAGLRAEVRRYFRNASLPIAGLFLLVVPVTPLIVRVAAGSEFEGAVVPAQILFLSSAAWIALSWVRPAIFAVGDLPYWLVHRVSVVVITVGGFVTLVPASGATGMALTRLIATPLLFGVGAVRLFRRHLTPAPPPPSARLDGVPTGSR